jgi:predicted short-subunit dehydrogenase-like oxidoreductase (DUF2520 family)
LSEKSPRIGFIGAGTVANALARSLQDRGYTVTAVSSRTFSSAQKLAGQIQGCAPFEDKQKVVDSSDIIFITTPDGAISQVSGDLKWGADKAVVHCSGADTSEVLAAAAVSGAQVGVFHPLQTFSGKSAGSPFTGITFSIESQEPLLSVLKTMATDLVGKWIVLRPEDKPLYHASAVMVSNYMIALVKMATDLWADFGVPRDEAVKALLPLIRGGVDNLEKTGLPNCLTGPISRGDSGTIAKHLNALGSSNSDFVKIYKQLGLQILPTAIEKGKIIPTQASEIEALLKGQSGERNR